MDFQTRLMARAVRCWCLGLSAGLAASAAATQEQELGPVLVTAPAERRTNALALDWSTGMGSRLGLTPQQTPAALYLLTSEQMHERGQRSTQEALESAPGVVSGQCFGFTCVSLRGFSGALQTPFLFDGLRYPGLAMSPRGTFVYDRIEVIKGPSSVLHGLGSVAGAVNFVTRPADGRAERKLLLATDSWQNHNLGLGLGGAWSPALTYRFDFNAIEAERGSSGWVDRTAFRYAHAVGELAWRINPRLRLSLSAQKLKDEGQWYFGTPLVDGRLDERVRERNYNVSDSHMRKRAEWLRVNLHYDISSQLRLRNETYANEEWRSWRNAEVHRFNPHTGRVDLSDFMHIVHDQALLGNRTELSAEHPLLGLPNRFVLGFDWSRNRHQRASNTPFAAPAVSVDFFHPQPPPFVSTSPFLPVRRTVLDQQAWFAENLLSLTDAWRLSLSARHDRIDLDSYDLRLGSHFDRHWSANSWRVGTLWDVSPGLTLYAQVARAFEPPAQVVTLTPAQRHFDLTQARQTEVGFKGQLPNGRGELTLALFDIVRSNILTRDPMQPGQTIQIGQQSSQGLEFDLLWRLNPHWTLGLNGTRLEAQFDRFIESVGGAAVSRAGLLPPDTPESVTNLYARWQASDTLQLHASLRHVGARSANNANTVWLPGYTTMNLSLAWWVGQGEWALHLRNALDEVYLSRSAGGGAQALLGEPRALKLSYTVHF